MLIDDHLADAAFLREVVDELTERDRHGRNRRAASLLHVPDLEEALGFLAEERFDLLLMDASPPGSNAVEDLRRIRTIAPDLPVVIVADQQDDGLAVRLLREGVQDYLLKSDLDAERLGQSMLFAGERQRVVESYRKTSLHDPVTGLYNRSGFVQLAQQVLELAAQWRQQIALIRVQSASSQQLALMETADALRLSVTDSQLIGYLGDGTFAIAAAVRPGEGAAELTAHLEYGIRSYSARRAWAPLNLTVHVVSTLPDRLCSAEDLLDGPVPPGELARC